MKLSNASIKKLIKGACYHEERDGYLYSYHYTKEQLDYFKPLGYWYDNARALSSGRIEMITDATELSFKYYKHEERVDHCTFDLYINGVAHAIHYTQNVGGSVANFTLPDGEKHICIYFPSWGEVGIKALTINGKYKSVKKKQTKLLALGDSITQGYGAFWAGAGYINVFSRLYGCDLLSQAIGGYRFDEGGVQEIPSYKPDKILVALGTNFHNSPSEYDYEKEVEKFFQKLRAVFGVKPVLVVTPVWRNDNPDRERFAWCIEVIKAQCAKYENIAVVDGLTLIPNINECYLDDKVHPNAYGMLHMGENLYRAVKKIKF